jgi:hypothetical protein
MLTGNTANTANTYNRVQFPVFPVFPAVKIKIKRAERDRASGAARHQAPGRCPLSAVKRTSCRCSECPLMTQSGHGDEGHYDGQELITDIAPQPSSASVIRIQSMAH